MSAWSSTAACRDIQTSEYRQKAYNELQPHPRTQKPLDIHSSRQVRSLPKRISGSCRCPVSAARLPGHCFWISNSIPRSLWVCPRSALSLSCSSSIKCPNDSTKWTTPSLPYLYLTWGTPQSDVHALRPKSRTTLHCLYRMCALKHGRVTPGQPVQAFSPATEGLEGA